MPSLPPPGPDRRLAVLALAVCALAVAAAVVSFARGSFIGIVWILLAGVSSNMAWFYFRKAKLERARQAEVAG
ncbi:hypothetical protein ACFU90_30525 [Streptomyces noursei]|uniref:Uncharacterized protein n=1 Tax=Streptomyces noursei TaxID=1971 RepID=A0A059W1W1_STRNR|nr:hypothetical protein [Streptomyces noursei]AIA03238.1 hypothetical protein DC74_2738 [Streptomyces noursei]EPY92957.1 hypothetical protein K530_50620 [Streptomyces noursei CCRC 11814]EXU85777.1 membrane protein [Streptomyces noursei PD-1]MCZ0973968.1 hypothetical protein [Streptomyces noursei]UWS72011.1 hypothetical protein N1H47_12550 [Streptomyces noursei]